VSKIKEQYDCSNCGHISIRWIGCCPSCNEWNSFVKQKFSLLRPAGLSKSKRGLDSQTNLQSINEINIETQSRMLSGIKEWDRVLGGGILQGAFMILTGDPGIGKSTLILQIADRLAEQNSVIYFSSEESLQQVKNRATRLGINKTNVLFSDQSNLENIIEICLKKKPQLLILDSIQNCHLSLESLSIPGTISQLRESGFKLMKLAKENNIAVLATGHITKEGYMAGPKVLEHMVDAVFYLQEEDRWQTRVLRSVKNRFGAINEIGFFQMHTNGLEEISNINKQLLSDVSTSPGSILICSMEGSRPILLEMQALCVPSKFGMPQRVVTGIDQRRVVLIAAILEKYLRIKFSAQDIFFKVGGGFKIRETSSDLGIALALLSSYFQKPLPQKTLAIAETSLTGQIKPANQIDVSVKEAEKFGIENICISSSQKINCQCKSLSFKNVYELLKLFPRDTD
jgi:DNA repair protein RadA/Sms